MSPELLPPHTAGRISPSTQTDVWAFGVLLWECMTGQRPFAHLQLHKSEEEFRIAIINHVSGGGDVMAAAISTRTDGTLEAMGIYGLVRDCLQRTPAKRTTMAAVALALKSQLARVVSSPPSSELTPKPHSRVPLDPTLLVAQTGTGVTS